MSSPRPTIRDVARLAGVSHQTVSRVINRSSEVTPETRERVEAAILELGYRPNAIARSMARGETRILACIAPNLTDFTFASIIEGAEQEARASGYLLLSLFGGGCASVRRTGRRTGGTPPRGWVAHHQSLCRCASHAAAERIFRRCSWARTRAMGPSPASAWMTRRQPRAATRHLLERGYRRLAHLSGPLVEDCVIDRRAGFLQALRESGLEFDDALFYQGDWSASSGRAALRFWAAQGRLPEAVFAQNDRMALGVLHAARELGLRVPDELGVIGVDDMPLSSYFDPPLTTMRQDMPRIGREAARLLLERIRNPRAPVTNLKLPAELVVRESTRRERRTE